MGYGEWIARSSFRVLYRLEDATDSSGNAITLTNLNSVTFSSGRFINGADFGSSGNNKCLTESASGNIMSALTVSAYSVGFWFKLNNTSSANANATITSISTKPTGTGGQRWTVTYSISGGNCTITMTQSLSTTNISLSYTFTADSAWHRVEYVRSSTTAGAMYFDGASVNTATGSGTDTSASEANGTFISLGNERRSVSPARSAWVMMDNYSVEEISWSQDRISKFYTQAKGGTALLMCASY